MEKSHLKQESNYEFSNLLISNLRVVFRSGLLGCHQSGFKVLVISRWYPEPLTVARGFGVSICSGLEKKRPNVWRSKVRSRVHICRTSA